MIIKKIIPLRFRWMIESILNAYSMVLFTGKKSAGFVLMLLTFFDPIAGGFGLIGIVLTNLISYYLGVIPEKIKKGLYGFNGLLVGLAFPLYHAPSLNLFLLLFVACLLLVIVTIWLEGSLGYFFGLPALSFPFVIVTFLVYLSFFYYNGLVLKTPSTSWFPLAFPEMPKPIEYFFKSLGYIYFQSNLWASLGIGIVIFSVSRVSMLLAVFGFACGSLFQVALGGNIEELATGVVGFNYILTSIALGGIFLVPSIHSFLLAGVASMAVALVSTFIKVFFYFFNLPVLSFPFVIVTLLFLYTIKQLRNPRFRVMDLLPGSPEENLEYYNTRLKRFGGLSIPVRLPFLGSWKVTQGYSGKHTHKEDWKFSLDFMAVDSQGKLRRGIDDDPKDYFTFSLPVLAPSDGKVIKVVDHLPDNELYQVQVEAEDKWGNYVIIEHAYGLYSQLSHLKHGSVIVKEGMQVSIGSRIALAGNSGRSPEPHLHMHFQLLPDLGSMTYPVPFTQYIKMDSDMNQIVYSSTPNEGEVLSSDQPDISIKNFFQLLPGKKFPIKLTKGKYNESVIWTSKLDLFGGRYLEDEQGNLLYFLLSNDYFAALDYQGVKSSALYYFFIASYRVPFQNMECSWEESISYKYFSSVFTKLLKDTVSPFTNKISYIWSGKIFQNQSHEAKILKSSGELFAECIVNWKGNFPGEIQIKQKSLSSPISIESGIS
jgi:urea transporter/murein DD-endopeptidase MepM/ murein hydrolase activator NlpD